MILEEIKVDPDPAVVFHHGTRVVVLKHDVYDNDNSNGLTNSQLDEVVERAANMLCEYIDWFAWCNEDEWPFEDGGVVCIPKGSDLEPELVVRAITASLNQLDYDFFAWIVPPEQQQRGMRYVGDPLAR
jgi:hypothetical protein